MQFVANLLKEAIYALPFDGLGDHSLLDESVEMLGERTVGLRIDLSSPPWIGAVPG
jgi:hypothetical protein